MRLNMGNERQPVLTAHKICLIALFMSAGIITAIPSGIAGLLQSVIIYIALLALMPLIIRLFNIIFSIDTIKSSDPVAAKFCYTFIYFVTALGAVWFAGIGTADFAGFAATVIIPDAPVFLIELFFLAAAVWLAMKNPSVILKITLVVSVIIFISVILLFIISIPHWRTDAASLIRNFDNYKFTDIYSWQGNPALRNAAALLIVFALLACLPEKAGSKSLFTGIILGTLLFTACMIQTLLIFNEKYLATLTYPYLSSVSILSSDEVFLRMDVLVYLMFYTCCLIKTSVCLLTIRLLASKYNEKSGWFVTAASGLLIIVYQLIFNPA